MDKHNIVSKHVNKMARGHAMTVENWLRMHRADTDKQLLVSYPEEMRDDGSVISTYFLVSKEEFELWHDTGKRRIKEDMIGLYPGLEIVFRAS